MTQLFLQNGDGPADRVEVTELRAPAALRRDFNRTICSDNPVFRAYDRSQLSLTVPALKRVSVKSPQIQFPQHLIRLDGRLYHDLCINQQANWRSEQPRHVVGNLALSTNGTFHNFYHWMTECLPSARAQASSPILMPPLASDWQRDSLRALDIAPDGLSTASREVVALDQLNFLTTTNHLLTGANTAAAWGSEVTETFCELARRREVTRLVGTLPSRFFISRKDAGKRPFEDEPHVTEFLRSMGIETIVLSEMSLAEQTALFLGAKAVIGTHGAGLVHILHCQPGTKVFEIAHPSCRSTMFLRMAALRDLHYGVYQDFDPQIPSHARLIPWRLEKISRLLFQLTNFLSAT